MSKEIIIKIPFFETSAPTTESSPLPEPSRAPATRTADNPVPGTTSGSGYSQRPSPSKHLPEPLPAERLAMLADNQTRCPLPQTHLPESPPTPHSNPGPEEGAYVAGKADPDKK